MTYWTSISNVSKNNSFRNEDAWMSSPTPEINIEVTPETPTAPKRKAANVAKAKEMWGSEEADDDILDRFLKAKRFQVYFRTYCFIYRPPTRLPRTPKYSYCINCDQSIDWEKVASNEFIEYVLLSCYLLFIIIKFYYFCK